ncbi:hypothetical protein FRC11_014252, partial [Ceratobasidium sp. 423]
PKPLTDRGWTSLKPKLTALLETNRKQRLEKERQTRKQAREVRLTDLFRAIKDRDILTVEVSSHSPDSEGPTSASYEPPFPNFSHTLKSPVILDLCETDRSVAEMEAKLEQHREEIEGYMTEWKNDSTLIAHDKKSDPFAKLPDDIKRLLRADSLFSTTSLVGLGRPLTYGCILKLEGLNGTHLFTAKASSSALPNLDHIRWDPEANKAARELLTILGKPNVTYLEMTDKPIYTCGRCHNTEAKTWGQMVEHYAHQKRLYEKVQESMRSSGSKVTYNNVHDPKLRTKQPLVRYSGTKATNESERHGITEPELHEEYSPQISEESEAGEFGYYDSDDGFGLFDEGFLDDGCSEGGGCAYARRRLAGYGYGRRRYNRHYYSRPRCVYYAGDDDWW